MTGGGQTGQLAFIKIDQNPHKQEEVKTEMNLISLALAQTLSTNKTSCEVRGSTLRGRSKGETAQLLVPVFPEGVTDVPAVMLRHQKFFRSSTMK